MKKALQRRADTRLVVRRPHRFTTLPEGQVGVGVNPSLDDGCNIPKWQRLSILGVLPQFLARLDHVNPYHPEMHYCRRCRLGTGSMSSKE